MIVLARVHNKYSRFLFIGMVFSSLDAFAACGVTSRLAISIDETDLCPEFIPSTLITDVNVIDTNTKAVTVGLNQRVNKYLSNRKIRNNPLTSNTDTNSQGISAGSPVNGVGVWANYGYSDFENDLSSTQFDGRTHTALIGIDFMPTTNTVVGIAFGLENTETDTDFNSGKQKTNGFTIAPYAGVAINEHVTADVSFGYTKSDNEQESLFNVTGLAESDHDSSRWFANLNLNGIYSVNNWLFTGQYGMLWAKQRQDQFQEMINGVMTPTVYTKRHTELNQFYLSAEAAYSINQFEPYARLSYVRDFSRTRLDLDPTLEQASDDKDEFLVGGGLRVFADNGFSGNFEYNKRLGRDDFEEDVVSFFLRMDM